MTSFARQHIGPSETDQRKMLAECGFGSLDELTNVAVPRAIRTAQLLALPAAVTELEATRELREIGAANTVLPSISPPLGSSSHLTARAGQPRTHRPRPRLVRHPKAACSRPGNS